MLDEGCRTAVLEITTYSKPPNVSPTSEAKEHVSTSRLALALGLIVGILAICIIAVVVAVTYYRRRKKRKGSYQEDPEEKKEMLTLDDDRALARTKRAFQTGKFVVLKGIQGAGKTFLAERLRGEWIKQNADVKWICEPKCISEISEGIGYCILDDLFYELQLEKEVLEVRNMVDELYERVSLNGDRKILLIVTSLIMDRCPSLFAKHHYQNMIDLDHLCTEDLKEILEFHMEQNNIVRAGEDYRKEKRSTTQMSEDCFERAMATTDYDFLKGQGIGKPASIALACKLIGQNKFNGQFGRWMKTPVSWLFSDLNSLLNDKRQKRSIIALTMVAFQPEELSPDNINSDLLNKLMKLENCNFNMNSLIATLKELRTYLEEKDGHFTFQVPIVRKVLLKIIFQKYPELITCCDEKIRKRRVCDSLPADIYGEYRKSFYIKKTKYNYE
ncbi:uncharacterized protein LOC128160782 [Crassostrea angulata]|uniref:uncharacterized protein LOC128160782 n=1 Tax=Magallana angulata TaxID=2784310 RepID=UPI0022B193DF|nr:uncharacterized protein LOC128160782 [Crassostrea angulata]